MTDQGVVLGDDQPIPGPSLAQRIAELEAQLATALETMTELARHVARHEQSIELLWERQALLKGR